MIESLGTKSSSTDSPSAPLQSAHFNFKSNSNDRSHSHHPRHLRHRTVRTSHSCPSFSDSDSTSVSSVQQMPPLFIENINNNNMGEDNSIDDEESTIINGHGVSRHRYYHQNDRHHHRHEPDFWLEDAPRYYADDLVTLPRSELRELVRRRRSRSRSRR